MPLQRAEDTGDASKAVVLKLKKRDDETAENSRKKTKRAEATNTFSEVGLLVTTAAAKASLKAKTSDSKGVELLEEQMNARTKRRGRVLTYKCINERLLSSLFKEPTLKLTPAGANAAAKLKYLTDMMHAVIKYDKERKLYTSASLASASGIVLSLWLKRLSRLKK